MTGNAPHDNTPAAERLLTPGEVAALWQVDTKTVCRWADRGWGDCIRTPGGQRRFRESAVRLPVNGGQS
jgi:predicted site-specific integrase-resolvase